jgi:hypothetical protein
MISEIDAGEGDFLTTDCTDYTDLMRGGTSALVAQRLSPRADSIRRSKVHPANVVVKKFPVSGESPIGGGSPGLKTLGKPASSRLCRY